MNEADEETSEYHLWYEFLRLTDPSTWSAEVKRDFGGVLTMDFDSWFDEVRFDLFAPNGPIEGGDGSWFKRSAVRQLHKGQCTDDINFDTHIVLIIDRSRPLSKLQELVNVRLQLATAENWNETVDDESVEVKPRKRGTKPWAESHATYPFKKRPDVEALQHVLYVHDLQRDNPTWKHWMIGVKAKKRFKKLLPLMKLKEGEEPTMEQKEILNAKVGYFLARAKKIKAGVIEGVFPAV